jgi:hypothetical protein
MQIEFDSKTKKPKKIQLGANYFFQIKKYIVKENSGYLRIFHLLK